MRLYCFTNYYLSSLQKGLQTAHVVSELGRKYRFSQLLFSSQYLEWIETHKTIIILDGGNQSSLQVTENLFSYPGNPYPWASFREDNDSLNGCLTAVGILLPEHLYEIASLIRSRKVIMKYSYDMGFYAEGLPCDYPSISNFEMDVIELINSSSLAN